MPFAPAATAEDFLNQLKQDSGRSPVAIAPQQPTTIPSQTSEEPSPINPDNPEIGFTLPQAETSQMSLLPLSQQELQKQTALSEASRMARPQVVPPSAKAAKDLWTQLGARPGVHFDPESGIPFISRLASEREATPDEQIGALQKEYGKENVRVNAFGKPVVTTTDEHGRTVDKLVDPIGLDTGDLATFMSQTPELAGSIIPMVLTRGATLGPGILRALGTLGLTTGGAELAGAAKDMFRRWMEGRDIEPMDIATRHGVSGTVGVGLGAVMGAGGKIAGTLISPFSSAGHLQFNAQEAVRYFKDKYGIELSQTAAEKTGSQILQAAEAMEAAKPGSRTAFARFRSKQLEQINKLRDIATGKVEDEEVTGKRITTALKEKLTPLEFDIQEAAQNAERQAAEAIKTTIGSPVDKVRVGTSIDLGAKARKSAFDLVNDANYSAFYNHPKSTEAVIGGDKLKSAVDDMIEDLPAVTKTVTKPSKLLDPFKQPIPIQVDVRVPVATPVRERLEEISRKLEGGRISINDLKGIRTDVDNAIKTGEAVPGVKEGRLKKYYSELTKAIQDGLQEINDPQLTRAWEKATDYYKKNVGKFEKAGIAEIFRDPINAMGPTELVERASRSPDIYAAYKEFFGANSPQIKGIHQATKDDILQLGQLGKTVDATAFANRLEALDQNSPQLLRDAFGSSGEFLRTQANVMRAAQGLSIPKAELDRAISSGTLSGDSLRDMIAAQARRDESYANTLVRELSTGTIKPDKIKPTEVVDKLVFRKATQPEELASLMDMASDRPSMLEDLRRLTFKKVLDDATITARNGERILSAQTIEELLEDQNMSKKLQTVLGPESYEDLVRFKDFLKPGEIAQEAYKSAGGLAGGSQISQMVEKGSLKYVSRAVKNLLLGTIYTSEPIKKLLTNQVLDQEGIALRVNATIASAPFLRALTSTYTKEASTAAMIELKGAVDQMAQAMPETMQQGPTRGTEGIQWDQYLPKARNAEEFLQQLKTK